MKEKERYYSLIDNNGNFELRDYENGSDIYSTFELDELLNQQDKRIKELEEESQQLKERISKQFDKIQTLTKTCDVEKEFGDKMALENRELKQSQKKLALNELVKLRRQFFDLFLYPTFDVLSSIIDKQIEKLKGE